VLRNPVRKREQGGAERFKTTGKPKWHTQRTKMGLFVRYIGKRDLIQKQKRPNINVKETHSEGGETGVRTAVFTAKL
jgi:hypothetical protein